MELFFPAETEARIEGSIVGHNLAEKERMVLVEVEMEVVVVVEIQFQALLDFLYSELNYRSMSNINYDGSLSN